MTTIKTTTRTTVNRQYDEKRFNMELLGQAKAKLSEHLKNHREIVNEFIRQQYFADACTLHPLQTMNGTIASLAREGYTAEIINLYSLTCKYFGGSLPTQGELEKLDAFALKRPSKEKKTTERGAKALLEKWEKFAKRVHDNKDAKDYEIEEAKIIAFALLKLKEAIEKNEI